MEKLAAEVLCHVFSRITNTPERNTASLVCKKFYNVERLQRRFLGVGCGLHPVEEALLALCHRFPNLTTVKVTYSGWIANQGKQMDDEGLAILAENCPLLSDLSLGFCCYVTDTGLGSLACSRSLEALRLNFVPKISGIGLLSLAGIKTLELTRCLNVYGVEWLEFLGAHGNLENLSIRNCCGIGEADLAKLGRGWGMLHRFVFQVDENSYRFLKTLEFGNVPSDSKRVLHDLSCDALEVLSLSHCIITPRRGLGSVLTRCSALVELQLDMCLGVGDEEVISVAQKCTQLKSLLLRLPSNVSLPEPFRTQTRLSNASFCAIATHCTFLEKVSISFADAEFPLVPHLPAAGITALVQSCSFLKQLLLEKVSSFNDMGMEAVCSSRSLEILELVQCQEVGDQGVRCVANSSLKELRLCQCLRVTNAAFSALVGTQKLDVLRVEDCPQISENGTNGVAKAVYYRRDLFLNMEFCTLII